MTADSFLDTNILLYFISKAPKEQAKAARATELVMQDGCAVSTQVLSEFYVNATQKAAYRLSHAAVMAFLESLAHLPTAVLQPEHIRGAAQLAHQRKLSYWDACIVIAAQSLQCTTLYTEDMQHNQRFGHLRVVNPFM